MYQISRDGQNPVVVKTIKAILAAICLREPGRYEIDEIRDEPPPSGQNARRWGIGIKWADGTLEVEPDPREA